MNAPADDNTWIAQRLRGDADPEVLRRAAAIRAALVQMLDRARASRRRAPATSAALYSNTARAHELGRVHDWVVRGREAECAAIQLP